MYSRKEKPDLLKNTINFRAITGQHRVEQVFKSFFCHDSAYGCPAMLKQTVLTLRLLAAPAASYSEELLFPISAAYGTEAACFRLARIGHQAVFVDRAPPGEPDANGDILLIDRHQITSIEMVCKPLEVTGQKALIECVAEGTVWTAPATFVEADDGLLFSGRLSEAGLVLTDTFSKCVID